MMQRGPAIIILGVDIRTRINQGFDVGGEATRGCNMQRGSAPVIKGVNIQAPINQGANIGGVAGLGGNMQRVFVNSHGDTISTTGTPL